MLIPSEFELWKTRIKQYLLMTDYALWEVIVNGDSPLPKRTIDGVEKTYPPTTTEEKLARKNELKARGTLLMALPNKHQLKFNTYKCAKSLMEAIEKRFGGNKESKKTQKTLLKQQYENFNGSSSEFLRSLPSEWKTHTLIWRNKPDLETLSTDDIYNNLKIYETEFKGSSSSSQNSQNVAFESSNSSSSTNQAHGSNFANIDSMSDAIDDDNLEDIDLKWQMAMLTMKARIFLNKTGRKISANGSETIGFNKSKVKCYNCHKKGHFVREYRALRENRNIEPIRRNVTVETTETKSLVAQDGLGYDWSDQAEEGPTNFAFMAYTSSISSSSDSDVSTYSKACLKSYETLKEHYDKLTKDFNKSQLNAGAYKAGLESVEARLDVYKKNEAVFEEDIKILKLDVMLRDNSLTDFRKKFEKDKKERDDLKLTLKTFENSSKNLSKLLEIQVSDKFKTDVGFDSQVFDSQVFDSQENDNELVTSVPDVAISEAKSSESKPKTVSEPLIEDWISDNKDENETKAVLMKSGLKTLNTARQNSLRASVNTARPINTSYPRPTVNCARPASNVFSRAYSHVRRPFNKFTTNKNSNFNEKVNTVRGNVTNVGPKAIVSDNKEHEANAVKASTCWVWRPKQKVLDYVSRHNGASMNFKSFDYGNPQLELQEKGVIDSGCSRHMTGNKSYLSNYEEIDGGFVAFGGSTKGGKITSKGKIRIGKLDYEDVYFVKELKFNLFSVSQMCDKKNNVLFTDTKYVVLSPDFKLLDKNQVLLRVPRKNNMYSVDLKNVSP
ncbi:hypothetical protein Tco_0653154 [Tanacetum coccineum]|uniref:Retrovirus-related Pol polyprotein from transposon TNT 1-94-like beta-barrel domain-containing protein n=1 Tax=Tanacetum coccineum TaxID=301880 RepID=A0ABQ4X024_9ASTR